MGRPTGLLYKPISLPPDGAAVYGRALGALREAGLSYLVGGAWAMAHLAGVCRSTKDLDLFVRPADLAPVLDALAGAGFDVEVVSPRWLAKAWRGPLFVDIIFSSGNGIATVDDAWLTHAIPGEALDQPVLFCPVEETIWSKAWIMERERYDGADVVHLLRACGAELDWERLLARFGEHWRVLYGHLVLFGYVYPGERAPVPTWVLRELGDKLSAELLAPAGTAPSPLLCRGTLLSKQYLHDLDELGYIGPDEPLPLTLHDPKRSHRSRG